jgi:hypothetical protein
MRNIACEQCTKSVPQGSAFRVFDRVLCEACATADLQARTEVPEGSVSRVHDPTVCGVCGYDGGTVELATVGEIPVCEPCEGKLRNRPYPLWVKAALAAVLALTMVAMVRNYRFFHGYFVAKQAERAAAKRNFELAAAQMESAAKAIPESKPYRYGANVYKAFALMQGDRSAEALPILEEIARQTPGEPTIRKLVLQADVGVAFDAKDYARMVKSCKELAEMNPDQRMAKLALASAYACQFAARGDEEARKEAASRLPSAEERATISPEEQKYVNRIEHRLTTREIINSKEFERRFPQGWKAGEEPR